MPASLSRTLFRRTSLLVLLVLVPALAVIVYDQARERRRARVLAHDEAFSLAQVSAGQVSSVLEGVQGLLLTLAQVPGVPTTEGPACDAFLAAELRESPRVLNLGIVNTDGRLVCVARPVDRTPSSLGLAWFTRVMSTRAAAVGDFQRNRLTGEPSIVLAQPILRADGQVDRIVGASITLEQLLTVFSPSALPNGVTLTLFDRRGTILARAPSAAASIGTTMPLAAPEVLAAAEASGVVEDAAAAGGVRQFWSVVPGRAGRDSGLFVSTQFDTAAAMLASNELLRWQLGLLAVLTLASFGLGLFGGRQFLLQPIDAVQDVFSRLANGDFTARLRPMPGVPGMSDLVSGINGMAAGLEARQAEREQSGAQQRLLSAIVESTEDAVVSTSLDGTIMSWNAGAEQLYGFTAAEAIGQPLSIVVPEERAGEVRASLEAQGAGMPMKQYDTERRRKDGSVVPVSITLSSIKDRSGAITGGAGIVRNISERRRVEEALRHAEERLRYALDTARVGIWEGHPAADRFFWSELYEKLHGLAPGTFGGRFEDFIACVHPGDRDQVLEVIARAGRLRQAAEFEYRTIWPDGKEHWIRAIGHYEYDDTGTPVRGAGIAVDVTAQRLLEEQFRQAQKMDAIGKLAGGVAHDFNNMLTAILGYAGFLLESLPADDPRRSDVEEIVKAGQRSAGLTRQLLAFSRRQILEPRIVRLADVVSGVTPMLRRLLGETVDLHTGMGDRGSVKADVGQIEQVLVNLAVNARDAMPDGGRLTIETADVVLDAGSVHGHPGMRPGPHVMIAVTDTGHGIEDATLRRIFEPFFSTKPKGEGTGLGLATVYGIVKQSDGYIGVTSAPGSGTTFRIYLPRTDEVEEVDREDAKPQRAPRGTETILLLEDEDVVREFASKALMNGGYDVRVAQTSQIAIDFARECKDRIHLLLTDVVLPGTSGPAAVAQMSQHHPNAAVLYMSGYTDDAIVHHGVLAAGVALLPKPFTSDALLRRVRDTLDRNQRDKVSV